MKKSKLDKFWEITSKWYFFPALYLILSFLIFIYLRGYEDIEPIKILLLTIYLVPNGVFYFIYLYTGNKISVIFGNFLPLFYFTFVIVVTLIIQYFKLRKNRIIKWLILLILLLFILTFFGCAAGQWQDAIYFEPTSLFG